MLILEHLHETAVARRLALLQRLDRHVAEETARTAHLEAISKELYLHLASANEAAVVAMRDRVQDSFVDRSPRVFGDVGMQQAIDTRRRSDAAHDVGFGLVDHLDDRSFELLIVDEAFTTGTLLLLIVTGVLQERNHQLRLELLRVCTKGKQTAEGWTDNAIDLANDAESNEGLLQRGAQEACPRAGASQLLDEGGDTLSAKIAETGSADGLFIERRLRTALK
jgi:hypothetical protein